MRIVKTCLYRTRVYNLLPTVLLTPLYSVVSGWPSFAAADLDKPRAICTHGYGTVRTPCIQKHWTRAGFRLQFKFICFHAGIEVHYG